MMRTILGWILRSKKPQRPRHLPPLTREPIGAVLYLVRAGEEGLEHYGTLSDPTLSPGGIEQMTAAADLIRLHRLDESPPLIAYAGPYARQRLAAEVLTETLGGLTFALEPTIFAYGAIGAIDRAIAWLWTIVVMTYDETDPVTPGLVIIVDDHLLADLFPDQPIELGGVRIKLFEYLPPDGHVGIVKDE